MLINYGLTQSNLRIHPEQNQNSLHKLQLQVNNLMIYFKAIIIAYRQSFCDVTNFSNCSK